MGLNETAREIEANIVNDTDGWGEDVTYTPRSTNIPVVVRALCMDQRQIQLNEKAAVYDDGKAFLSVFLAQRPAKGDTMTHDGIVYVIENMEGVNPYDIFCRANARHSRGRSGRVEK